jgi:DNA polymerase
VNLSEVVLVDFETRSRADLTVVGGRVYVDHPTTEVVCACFYADGEALTWFPGDAPPPYAACVAAHNADGFDTHVWRRLGWPEPGRWVDTTPVCASAGLPRKLADIGRRFGFAMKDETGSAVTRSLSSLNMPATRRDKAGELVVCVPEPLKAPLRAYYTASEVEWAPIPQEVLALVARYCAQDVGVMASFWPAIQDFVDLEPEVCAAWRLANERGVAFDSELAQALLEADAHAASQACDVAYEAVLDEAFPGALKAAGLVGAPTNLTPAALRRLIERGHTGTVKRPTPIPAPALSLLRDRLKVCELRYHATFLARMRALGVHPEDSTYESISPFSNHENPAVRDLVASRFSVASVASGKLRAGLARTSSDGRMRDNVVYFAAHTGRGGGSGMQLQNFPHPEGVAPDGTSVKKWKEPRLVTEAARAPERPAWTQAEVSALLRACVHAPPGKVLVCADFSGVEARGNAYAAHDASAVANFRAGGDAYAPFACLLFGIAPEVFDKETHFTSRDTAKKGELGCGYGMGPAKFVITAEKGGMVWAPPCGGPQCASPLCGTRVTDERGNVYTHGAYVIVHTWRALHAPIVQFWHALADCAVRAVASGGTVHVPADVALSFVADAGDLALVLPSGRPVVYRRAALERGPYGPQVRFEGKYGPSRLYGGLLCENAIQAMCRDLMVNGMVNAEAAGLPVVLTVHDEIVCEVPRARADTALEELIRAMCTLPAWARDMPITAEGFVGTRYRK